MQPLVTTKEFDFPNLNSATHGVDSVVKYFPYMVSDSDKSFRRIAKMKVQNNLRAMSGEIREMALGAIFKEMLTSRDICLHNYLVDVLVYQAEPDIDNRLIELLEKHADRFDDYIVTYVKNLLRRNSKFSASGVAGA